MDITIIGTGNMARGIATRALAGGHTVTLLGTDEAKAQALAGELSGDVRTGTVGDPISGDVVVLAVWYQALDDVLGRYGDQLAGKTVIDITNPVDPQTYAPLTVEAGSAAQEIAAKAPGREGRQGVQHHVRRLARRGPGRPASRSTSSSPPTTTTPRPRSASSPRAPACASSTPARSRIARQLEGAGYLHMAIQPGLGGTYASALKIVS